VEISAGFVNLVVLVIVVKLGAFVEGPVVVAVPVKEILAGHVCWGCSVSLCCWICC